MEPISLISTDLFDAIRSRFKNLEMGDESGMVTLDPGKARFFDFDFNIEGNNLGRVSVSINERGNLKVFYSQGILEDTDSIIQEKWFNFLRRMRNFAKRRLLRFDTRDITKSNLKKDDFKFLANQKDNTMSESRVYGSSRTSYMPLENTKIVVRHSQPVVSEVHGARSRHIESIFIQNSLGERFKMPLNDVRTARAMQRHVANGGRPYDNEGKLIIEMGVDCSQLKEFKRRCAKRDSMQETAHEIVERAFAKLENLKSTLESICTQRGYESWKSNIGDSITSEVLVDEVTMEDYKTKFSETTFREELSQYFPLLHKIMHEAGEIDLNTLTTEQTESVTDTTSVPETVKEFADFENWANLIESQLMTDDVIKDLREFLKDEPKAGVDGTNAIESLKDIGIDDEELTSMIKKAGSEGDLKTIITLWLSEKGDVDAIEKLELKPVKKDNEEESDDNSDTEIPEPVTPAIPSPEEPATPPALPPPTAESKDAHRKTKIRKVAEMVKSFYNAESIQQGLGPWPIGETAVVEKVKKEFGDEFGKLAEQFVQNLTRECMETHSHDQTFEDIMRLSGIKK